MVCFVYNFARTENEFCNNTVRGRNLQITFISSFMEKHYDDMYSSMHQGRAEYVAVFLATTIMVLHVVLWREVQ